MQAVLPKRNEFRVVSKVKPTLKASNSQSAGYEIIDVPPGVLPEARFLTKKWNILRAHLTPESYRVLKSFCRLASCRSKKAVVSYSAFRVVH